MFDGTSLPAGCFLDRRERRSTWRLLVCFAPALIARRASLFFQQYHRITLDVTWAGILHVVFECPSLLSRARIKHEKLS